VKRFAEAQRSDLADFEVEVVPGLIAGPEGIPVMRRAAMCPGALQPHRQRDHDGDHRQGGGLQAHRRLFAAPSRCRHRPAIIYAAHICGADKILAMGGVQGVAAMTFGLFGLPKANILVGPGNQFVAEAKRILFGRVGIDMIAGPTDSLILADKTADPMVVATDLVGQAEHGYNSPVWLVTDDRALAEEVMRARARPDRRSARGEPRQRRPPPGATMPR
jgi:sulfopropanediol 3-dehydrogenase